MAITRDNLHLSEPILDAAGLDQSPFRPAHPAFLDAAVRELLEAAAAPNTRRAYESDVRHFQAWGGSVPATPELVARYLAHHARTLAVATIARRLVAIRRAHALEGLQDPTASPLVRQTFRGLRRAYGRPQRRVAALTAEQLAAIVSTLGSSVKDIRDRALLLVGFAGAFRRSELVAIDADAIEWTLQGMAISLFSSKTDQEWRGRKVGIPRAHGAMCPVEALKRWLELAAITEGPVFRPLSKAAGIIDTRLSGEAVASIVKRRASVVGLDPAFYSGHSLRAGFATSAAAAGFPMWKIKVQTGHSSDAVLSRYIRLAV